MNTNRLIIFAILALVVIGGVLWYSNNNELPEINLIPQEEEVEQTNNMDELKIEDVIVGEGLEASVGDDITVHYVGTTEDGTVFDSSVERGAPITFGLIQGQLIQGWIDGIPGMREGGKRKLVVPGALAYGENPPPGAAFGPNATLLFEVELIKVEKAE